MLWEIFWLLCPFTFWLLCPSMFWLLCPSTVSLLCPSMTKMGKSQLQCNACIHVKIFCCQNSVEWKDMGQMHFSLPKLVKVLFCLFCTFDQYWLYFQWLLLLELDCLWSQLDLSMAANYLGGSLKRARFSKTFFRFFPMLYSPFDFVQCCFYIIPLVPDACRDPQSSCGTVWLLEWNKRRVGYGGHYGKRCGNPEKLQRNHAGFLWVWICPNLL